MFNTKKAAEPKLLQFTTRAEAFTYMLSILTEKGIDPMEAAEQAGRFAEIYGQNLGLPARQELPPEGIDKYLVQIDKLAVYCESHPKVVDLLIGAASFLSGLLVAGKGQQTMQTSAPIRRDTIDFDNIN